MGLLKEDQTLIVVTWRKPEKKPCRESYHMIVKLKWCMLQIIVAETIRGSNL